MGQGILLPSGDPHGLTDDIGVLMGILQAMFINFISGNFNANV
jgi:hypothetical protein